MRYRKIGNSDLSVSVIGLGTWAFGGDCWGEADDRVSRKVVERAVDSGVNFIDTAPIYGSGRSESVIGSAIRTRRKDVVIATKCGLEKKGHAIRPNLSAEFIREEIENSLKRMGLDVIDLYQCHWPDPNTSLRETFGELNELRNEGKIRYIGVSNFSRATLEKALEIAPVISNQVQYSLFDREVEKELLPFCGERDVSVLSYGPLGGGILTGKYKESPDLPRGDVRAFFYKFYGEPFWGKGRQLVRVLEEIADERGVSPSQVAINWVLRRPEAACAIAGCRTSEQLQQNAGAGDWSLDEKELSDIEEQYSLLFSAH
ncbi:MAG: aldo/keto reductase [Candidatus Omnitrophica bacterium]|nr:aldo/keto reductase [Candidatus Omnitrophota bacterium]